MKRGLLVVFTHLIAVSVGFWLEVALKRFERLALNAPPIHHGRLHR